MEQTDSFTFNYLNRNGLSGRAYSRLARTLLLLPNCSLADYASPPFLFGTKTPFPSQVHRFPGSDDTDTTLIM